MKRVAFLLLAAALAAPALAKEFSSAGSFLKDDRGAQLAAMGSTGVGVNGDLFALVANPATLSGLDRFQAAFEHDAMILDIAGNYAAVGGPLGDHFALGLAYDGVNYGTTLKTTVADPFGASNATFDGADQAVALSAAYRTGYYDNVHLGGALRYYDLSIDRFSAHGVAFDLGAQYDVWFGDEKWSGLRLGASITNLGTAIKFRNADEEAPITWRFGGTYRGRAASWDFDAAADIVGGHGQPTNGRVGLAIWPTDWLAIRGGYDGERDIASGLSAGLGFLWNDVHVDYAFIPYGDFGSRHRISLAYSWGTPRRIPSPHGRVVEERNAQAAAGHPRPNYDTRLEHQGLVPGQKPRPVIVEETPEVIYQPRREAAPEAPPPARVESVEPAEPPAPTRRTMKPATPPEGATSPEGPTRPASVVPKTVEPATMPAPPAPSAPAPPAPQAAGPVVLRPADTIPPKPVVEQPVDVLPVRAVPARPLAAESVPSVAPVAPSTPMPPSPAVPRVETVEVKELLRMASGMMDQERYPDAIALYNRALEADPSNLRALYNLATAQFLMKDYAPAKNSYKRFLDRQPNDAEAWFYLGLCQFKLGDIDNAVKSWKRTVAFDPRNEDAKSYLSSLGE